MSDEKCGCPKWKSKHNIKFASECVRFTVIPRISLFRLKCGFATTRRYYILNGVIHRMHYGDEKVGAECPGCAKMLKQNVKQIESFLNLENFISNLNIKHGLQNVRTFLETEYGIDEP